MAGTFHCIPCAISYDPCEQQSRPACQHSGLLMQLTHVAITNSFHFLQQNACFLPILGPAFFFFFNKPLIFSNRANSLLKISHIKLSGLYFSQITKMAIQN